MAAIEVEHLRFGLPGPQGWLEILTIPFFSVAEGETVVLHGPSGCGKSTLLHLLSGLLATTSGSVTVAGTRLDSLGERDRDRFRAKNIGYVFQSLNLLHGFTALENVLLGQTFGGTRPDEARARQLLTEVGLGSRLHHHPHQLSLGEQQRVAIARAVVHQPKVILADEPTASLDPRRAREVMSLIVHLARHAGSTLLVVSHDAGLLDLFDRRLAFHEVNRALTAPEEAKSTGVHP